MSKKYLQNNYLKLGFIRYTQKSIYFFEDYLSLDLSIILSIAPEANEQKEDQQKKQIESYAIPLNRNFV